MHLELIRVAVVAAILMISCTEGLQPIEDPGGAGAFDNDGEHEPG